MTKTELIAKLEDLEWEDFEVKKAESALPKDAWKSVSAFANTSGGWLVFGVEQKGKQFSVNGLKNPEKIEQDFLAVLRAGEKFNALITPICKRYKIDDKTILAFYIPASDKKPIYYGNNPSNTFIRKGSGDLRATKAEIDYMYRNQTFGVKSSECVENTSKDDLKMKSLREYRDYMARFNPTVSYNQKEMNDFLVSMRIIDKTSQECTFAGLLFFGRRESIERLFPDFRIDLLEIPGTSYQDAPSRYTFRLTEDDYENIWEAYFECFARLRKTVDVEFKLSAEGFGEELSPGLKAVREALVNMLMHADYFAPGCARVRLFTNRIEFYNPGGLPKPLEELKEKDLSLPRNPILAKLFRMVKLAENAGYGFDKIEANWKKYNHTQPEYKMSFDSVMVSVPMDNRTTGNLSYTEETLKDIKQQLGNDYEKNKNVFDKNIAIFPTVLQQKIKISSQRVRKRFGRSSERVRRDFGEISERLRRDFGDKPALLLFLMAIDPQITAKEASDYLEVSPRTVETYIAKLKKQKVIKRKGGDYGGEWQIIDGDWLNENEKT